MKNSQALKEFIDICPAASFAANICERVRRCSPWRHSDDVFTKILSKSPGNKSCSAPVSSLKGSFALETLETLDDRCVGERQLTT